MCLMSSVWSQMSLANWTYWMYWMYWLSWMSLQCCWMIIECCQLCLMHQCQIKRAEYCLVRQKTQEAWQEWTMGIKGAQQGHQKQQAHQRQVHCMWAHSEVREEQTQGCLKQASMRELAQVCLVEVLMRDQRQECLVVLMMEWGEGEVACLLMKEVFDYFFLVPLSDFVQLAFEGHRTVGQEWLFVRVLKKERDCLYDCFCPKQDLPKMVPSAHFDQHYSWPDQEWLNCYFQLCCSALLRFCQHFWSHWLEVEH